jgi:hypothetical protein
MNEQSLAIRPSPATFMAPAQITPMEMLNQAVERGANIEVLTKLMDLQERWEANQARKAFDEAISAAKAEIGPVTRNATGHNDKRYANFAAYARVVDPVISKFGLSYRFRTTQTDRINVTCILSHKAGHSEENTLTGPPDKTGSKNDIQAIGSTLKYLQRYSLVQSLGLSDDDGSDDDGHAAGAGDTITSEQAQQITVLIQDTNSDIAIFRETFGIATILDMAAKDFQRAITMLETKKRRQIAAAAAKEAPNAG